MSHAPEFEILAYEQTPLGILCLRRREILSARGTYVTEITLNHEFLMSSHNTTSEQALAQLALAMHAEGNTAAKDDSAGIQQRVSVLVGGLGLGCTAAAALSAAQVSRVDVIEFLPQVIDWLKRGLFPLAAELTADTRLSVRQDDVYRYLIGPAEQQFDVVLIDVDHSPDDPLDSNSRQFYTATGLIQVKKHLRRNGILAVWSYEEDQQFATVLAESFVETRVQPIEFTNELIDEVRTDWIYLARA